jgi:urocanate hydratase
VPLAAPSPEVLDFVARVAQAYAKLIASHDADPESGLGGRLFYAGVLDGSGRALVVAANIAGAATLVASADRVAQKQAIRDGVVDFLVTSLDEALRILKNQLRKLETVSVCVAMEPSVMELEMKERGVRPNLIRAAVDDEQRAGANATALLTWSVASAPAQWLPQLDAIAFECLDADAWAARRWLRLAPRYLGRRSQGIRAIACSQEVVSGFIERVQKQVERGEIGAPVEIRFRDPRGQHEKHILDPDKP